MAETELSLEDIRELATAAALAAGASLRMARVLADAAVEAERRGKPAVGLAHFIDYLDALAAGRIDGAAEPEIASPAPALTTCDVHGGVAQLGFEDAFERFVAQAGACGVALLSISNSFTTGELGWYVRRLAGRGLVAFAATNGPALMAPPGASRPVYCTNPIAFAAPGRDGVALAIDQSCGATTFVALRAAAETGAAIPPDWAVDEQGRPTTDARSALSGALLTFGGHRGANLALMVEVLAAGLRDRTGRRRPRHSTRATNRRASG